MSTVNVMAREVSAKVVFYGPGLSGKTTTLRRIYESIRPSLRGELMSLPTDADRTLFFDFSPVRTEKVGDYALRLAMYAVPGQVFYNATRKLVLQGADGIVFVADSDPGAAEANRESLANLEKNLDDQGVTLDKIPLIFQFNKRDLPQAVKVDELRARLNPKGAPDFETCAIQGDGVLEVMKAMVRLVIKDLRARKVVPAPRLELQPQATPLPIVVSSTRNVSLEDQLRGHLTSSSSETFTPPNLGPVATLAPSLLVDQARVAEAAFARGDFEGCLRACIEAVTRGLAFAGDGAVAVQGFLLGLDGRDLLELETRAARGASGVDDAAFALFALSQTFVRLTRAGLPTSPGRIPQRE